MSTREYRKKSLYLSLSIFTLTIALYLMLVYPVFLPADLTNPAVTKLIASPIYQNSTRLFFDELRHPGLNPDVKNSTYSEFIVVDPSQFGLIVSLHYKLSRQAAAGTADRRKYTPEISVRLSPPLLIVFIALEICMLILVLFHSSQNKPKAQLDFEELVLSQFYTRPDEDTAAANEYLTNIFGIEHILGNFHSLCLQLSRRRSQRPCFSINDEYDVQDLLHAILKLHFADVRTEEPAPSFAGAASRMDFLLDDDQIVIETKMTREGLRDKKIGEELLVDIARYASHPKCRHLICFVYDPKNLIVNPGGLRKDIENHGGELKVNVIISPRT